MRSTIAALGLLTATSLIANDCCAPCEPCCVPKPKKCIDCECYTPAFYDLQCDWGAFVDVEFLYWYARETNLSYALKFQSVARDPASSNDIVFAPQSYNHVDASWDPGVRIGLGWNSECDGWDYYLNWTYYRNKSRNSTSVPAWDGITTVNPARDGQIPALDEFAIINPWINPSFLGDNPQLFDQVNAKWNLTYNNIDLELGRKYWLSQCFNLRPYAGLRGAWIKESFRTKSLRNHTGATTIDLTFKDRFSTRTWGAGLLAGLQPTWYYCSNFALYANVDAALLWGQVDVKKRENYIDLGDAAIDYINRSRSEFYQMTAILDTALGLRWEESWCCDRYRTTFDLGWEHHIWFDQNHRNKDLDTFSRTEANPASGTQTTTTGFRTYLEETGNLGFGGLVIRLRFDF